MGDTGDPADDTALLQRIVARDAAVVGDHRHIFAGDFLHAHGDTDHGELYTEEGCRVILVVPPEDYFSDPAR